MTEVSECETRYASDESVLLEATSFAISLMREDDRDIVEPVVSLLRQQGECDRARASLAAAYPSMHSSVVKQIAESTLVRTAQDCIKRASKILGDEAGVKDRVLSRLSKHFRIEEEVWGTHWSGRRLRIDAVLTPIDDTGWKTKQPRLGVEFKNFRGFDSTFSIKDYSKWWSQCHDYAETKFDGHGHMYVFSYNGFSHYRQRISNESSAAFAVRFWGRLGVGELQPTTDGWPRKQCLMFVLHGTTKVWSEVSGVKEGRRMSMERKFGSR